MNGLIFISANGIGHAQRVRPVLRLLINRGCKIYILTGKKQCEFLEAHYANISNLVIIQSNYIDSVPSYNTNPLEQYINVIDSYQDFQNDLKNLVEIEFDFLISDNYVAPLKWIDIKKKILIANFLWGDIWDNARCFEFLSERKNWIQLESVNQNRNFVVASEIEFSTVKGLSDFFFKYIDIASYRPVIDQILANQKIRVLISLGRTRQRDYLFGAILDLLDKASTHRGILQFFSLGPPLEKVSDLVTFIDESCDFSAFDIVITRGGLGSLKDAVENNLFSFFVETDDFELSENQARARELGVGAKLCELELALRNDSMSDVVFDVCSIVNTAFEKRRDSVLAQGFEDLISNLVLDQ